MPFPSEDPISRPESASSPPSKPSHLPQADASLGELFQFLTDNDLHPARDRTAAESVAVFNAAAPNGQDSMSDEASERLRTLLLELLAIDQRNAAAALPEVKGELAQQLRRLEHRCRDPRVMGQVIYPIFATLLQQKITQSPEEIVPALALIIDQVLETQSLRDRTALSKALAAAIPGAISKQMGEAPDEVVQAIAPAMGKAITAQIRLDRDSMVDALYPVIGNTISKYMGEVVSQINDRVEQTFSLTGLVGRLSLRLQGISDAEQILRDVLPFNVQAVFLIHKESGLVIADVQQSGAEALEADMLAGMLTAIRSFAGECSTNPSHQSELTQIDYEDFQIIMEVAGYCYIAAVTQGDPPATFSLKLRQTMSAIILNHGYGDAIERFDGNPDSVPESITELLHDILHTPDQIKRPQVERRPIPWGLVLALGFVLALVGIPLGVMKYQWRQAQALAAQLQDTFVSTPSLALYRIEPVVKDQTITLTGHVPSVVLQEQAAEITRQIAPEFAVDNQVIAVDAPAEPSAIAAEAQRLTQSLAQVLATPLTSTYDPNLQQLLVQGGALSADQTAQLTESLRRIPGVQSIVLSLDSQGSPLAQRVYFTPNSVEISPQEYAQKLAPLIRYLRDNPTLKLRIVGHTDRSGTEQFNQQLAPQRAAAVEAALSAAGLPRSQLETVGMIDPPPQVSNTDALWLSRCVRFEVVN
jgi:outer membrane protein OmpA-like peptidoglycan-associated protein